MAGTGLADFDFSKLDKLGTGKKTSIERRKKKRRNTLIPAQSSVVGQGPVDLVLVTIWMNLI